MVVGGATGVAVTARYAIGAGAAAAAHGTVASQRKIKEQKEHEEQRTWTDSRNSSQVMTQKELILFIKREEHEEV